jgi:geranylgeranyl pyrophosphate synthase
MNVDILDFNGNEKFGKPLGQDLVQGYLRCLYSMLLNIAPIKNA